MESLSKVYQEPIKEHLANPLTLHEVPSAIHAIKSNKAPGLDRISTKLWKSSNALAEQLHKLLGIHAIVSILTLYCVI